MTLPLPATVQGKAHALTALAERRAHSAAHPIADQSLTPAGTPIVLPCLACGAGIVHPEDYLTRRFLCEECGALKECGWLE